MERDIQIAYIDDVAVAENDGLTCPRCGERLGYHPRKEKRSQAMKDMGIEEYRMHNR